MPQCKPIGYFVECPETHKLIELFGDLLELMTANDKLRLISEISLWLADDSNQWALGESINTGVFLKNQALNESAKALDTITPENALNLIAALIEQLRNGVYAE